MALLGTHPFCSLHFTKRVFHHAESGMKIKLFSQPINITW